MIEKFVLQQIKEKKHLIHIDNRIFFIEIKNDHQQQNYCVVNLSENCMTKFSNKREAIQNFQFHSHNFNNLNTGLLL